MESTILNNGYVGIHLANLPWKGFCSPIVASGFSGVRARAEVMYEAIDCTLHLARESRDLGRLIANNSGVGRPAVGRMVARWL